MITPSSDTIELVISNSSNLMSKKNSFLPEEAKDDLTTATTSEHVDETSEILSSKKTITTTTTPTTPVEFLENLFHLHGHKDPSVDIGERVFSSGPTEERIEAYNMIITRAVRSGNLEQVKQLYIEEQYSLDACNRYGESLLHCAARRGDTAMVQFMIIEANVPPISDDFGRNPFHDCLWAPSPNFQTMDVLLQVLPPQGLLMKDQRGHTPFDYAPRKDWDVWITYLQNRKDKLVKWLTLQNIMEGRPTVTSG